MITSKRNESIEKIKSWIRCKLNFNLLRSQLLCICGSKYIKIFKNENEDVNLVVSDKWNYNNYWSRRADDVAKWLDERNKRVIFKNCAPFTDCISEINNTQIDNAKYIDVVMPMYNLIEHSNNYSKTESLWQYYRNDPNDNITQSESFKFKIKITGKTPAAGNTKDVEIAVPLKYLSNFWRTLEMSLINCEINLNLTWSGDCVHFFCDWSNKI